MWCDQPRNRRRRCAVSRHQAVRQTWVGWRFLHGCRGFSACSHHSPSWFPPLIQTRTRPPRLGYFIPSRRWPFRRSSRSRWRWSALCLGVPHRQPGGSGTIRRSNLGRLTSDSTTTWCWFDWRGATKGRTAARLRPSGGLRPARTTPCLSSVRTKHEKRLSGEILRQMMKIMFLVRRTRLHHGGSERPARLFRLLCSFTLHGERKPLPQHHLAVQRWPHRSVAPLPDLWIFACCDRRNAAGWRSLSVSAGQRDRIGPVTRGAQNAVR